MIKAYLFDMDGTLLDTEVLWLESVQLYLVEKDVTLDHEELMNLVYGISWADIYKDIRARYAHLTQSQEEMSQDITSHFFRLREERDIRIQSSVDLLKRLSQTHPVAIVSGSDSRFIEYGIDLMEIRSNLQFYLAGDQYSPGKPDPTCYRMAAERLSLEPDECLVFEDSKAGILSAKAAGMHCVALARESRPAQDISGADWVLNDLERFDLDEYFRHINNGNGR